MGLGFSRCAPRGSGLSLCRPLFNALPGSSSAAAAAAAAVVAAAAASLTKRRFSKSPSVLTITDASTRHEGRKSRWEIIFPSPPFYLLALIFSLLSLSLSSIRSFFFPCRPFSDLAFPPTRTRRNITGLEYRFPDAAKLLP